MFRLNATASRFIRYRSAVIVSPILGFIETYLLVKHLEFEIFGQTAVIMSGALIIFGFFDARSGEIMAVMHQSGQLNFRVSLSLIAIDYFATCMGILGCLLVADLLYSIRLEYAFAVGLLALIPVNMSGFRNIIEVANLNYRWNVLFLFFRTIPSIYFLFVVLGVLDSPLQDPHIFFVMMLSIWVSLLLSAVALCREFSQDGDYKEPRRFQVRRLILGNWGVSTASGIYKQADTLLSGAVIGPSETAIYRLWMQVVTPISISTEARLQRGLVEGGKLMFSLRLSPEIVGGIVASVVLGIFYIHQFGSSVLESVDVGFILILNSVVVGLGGLQRIALLKKSEIRFLNILSWTLVGLYLTVAIPVGLFSKSLLLLIVIKVIINVMSIMWQKYRLEH